ncbi:MAG: hypothetical protein AAFW73_08395 [Bacteroidota bacterium]
MTRPNYLGAGSLLLLILLIGWACRPPLPESDFFLGGIQINEPSHRDWVRTLRDVGMNTVSVTVYARQGIWDSDNIWWEEHEPYVIKEIRTAKRAGMKVVLIPRIALDHYFSENAFLWHGMTMPATDSLLQNWFHWYGVFLERWARVADRYDVDVLAIGSELRLLSATRPLTTIPELEAYYLHPDRQEEYIADRMAFSSQIPPEDLWVRGKEVNYASLENYLRDEVAAKQTWARQVAYAPQADPLAAINQRRATVLDHWYALIAQIRGVYPGALTYAANFDNYQEVQFWDSLDYIGINAYFKLRELQPPSDTMSQYDEIYHSWKGVFAELADFQQQRGLDHKVLFTELGYIYRQNCTLMPWEGFGFSIAEASGEKELLVWSQQKPDQQERTLAVRALHAINREYDLLRGILYWKLTTKDYHLPYEPFALHLQREGADPLQEALLEFTKPEP